MFAGAALALARGHLAWVWRSFWLPVAGGVVWTSGNYAAFRASEAIGLARAAGSWTPLNIVVAFAWGAVLFGELDHLSGARFAVLGGALVLVVAGVLGVVRAQDARPARAPLPRTRAAPPARPPGAALPAPNSRGHGPTRAGRICPDGRASHGGCTGPAGHPRRNVQPAWPWPAVGGRRWGAVGQLLRAGPMGRHVCAGQQLSAGGRHASRRPGPGPVTARAAPAARDRRRRRPGGRGLVRGREPGPAGPALPP